MSVNRKIHYAWIVLAVSFVGVLAAQGVRFSFGAFIVPWEQFFSSDRGTITAISLVSYVVFAITQPIVGQLIDKIGVKKVFAISTFIVGITTILSYFATSVWQLTILYGVLASFGFSGASGVTASVAITKWFHKKRGLALGMVEAGFGAGQLVIVPASIFLIDAYGWNITVLVLGLFLLFLVFPVILFFLKAEPADAGVKPLGQETSVEDHTTVTMSEQRSKTKGNLSDYRFWFLLIPFFICGFTTTGLMDTHLIPFAQFCGFSPSVTSTAVSTLAAFNIIGTLVSGILADRWNNKGILSFLYFTRALTIVFLLIFSSDPGLMRVFLEYPVLLLVFSISFGLVDFATVAPTVKLLSEYFKNQTVGLLLGWLFMSHQLGSALGSYIPGILFDQTNSYEISFLISIGLLILAGILSALLPNQAGARGKIGNL